MTVRLVGGGMIFLASLLLSHLLCAVERVKLTQCESWLGLLRFVRGQIACFSRPFGEISRRIPPKLRSGCGLPAGEEETLAMLLQTTEILSAEAKRILEEFAAGFGHGYKHDQISACDAAIGALEEVCAAERRRMPERVKLCRCACICGGLAIILLLL